jgi:hypothetical protein
MLVVGDSQHNNAMQRQCRSLLPWQPWQGHHGRHIVQCDRLQLGKGEDREGPCLSASPFCSPANKGLHDNNSTIHKLHGKLVASSSGAACHQVPSAGFVTQGDDAKEGTQRAYKSGLIERVANSSASHPFLQHHQ